MKYSIDLTKEGKWFVAKAIELGVVSQGRTVMEAEQNLKEAVDLYLEKNKHKRTLTKIAALVTKEQVRA